MAGDPYSRLVAFLKVILPLIGLGILSTMFLVSSRIEPGGTIPFAEGEVTDRIRGQQVTGPLFSGVTADGDRIAFKADQLKTSEAKESLAGNLSARIDFSQGGSLVLVADTGEFRLDDDEATLSGNVLVESSTGYRMRSDTLETRLEKVEIVSPGEVRATGPAGNLTAGTMRIGAIEGEKSMQLLFSQGVKLIYDPQESR
ncbi:MAG: LPS export ABC transporter periplasmic protein LptC [Aliishimia sp.]